MLYDYDEHAKAEAELVHLPDWPPPGFVDGRPRAAELAGEAKDAGVVRAGYPGATNLARTYATCGLGMDAFNFRYLSGVVHGVAWAGVRGDHEEVVHPDDPENPVSHVKTSTSSSGTWYATNCALRHFEGAIEALEHYLTPRPR